MIEKFVMLVFLLFYITEKMILWNGFYTSLVSMKWIDFSENFSPKHVTNIFLAERFFLVIAV